MQSSFQRQFEPLYLRWTSDIFSFVTEGMRFPYHSQQAQLFQLVQNESILPLAARKKRIAVKSGQGPGKTAATVIIALWRVLRYPNALVIVTAPSMRQCKQWCNEAQRLLNNSHPFLRKFIKVFGTKIEVAGSRVWGVHCATATRPQNLQGIHEKRLTFVADEASGISAPIIETIEGTLSNEDSLFIQIGNPNTTDCKFYESFTSARHLWHTLTWNAEETSRERPDVVDPKRNEYFAMQYGRDSDAYRIRVLGEFPRGGPNSIFELDQLEYCTRTNRVNCAGFFDVLPARYAIGIDFARLGPDESVVALRQGLAIVGMTVFSHREPRDTVDFAFREQHDRLWKDNECLYVPDADGMGASILYTFHEAGKRILPFHTQARPNDSGQFANRMTEAWFNLRTLVRQGICNLPKDARLLQQLVTRQYYFTKEGKLKVETKDEWRKRLDIDESPDRADAVCMAFYCPSAFDAHEAITLDRRGRKVGVTMRSRSR